MPANHNRKRTIRALMAETGLKYTAAAREFDRRQAESQAAEATAEEPMASTGAPLFLFDPNERGEPGNAYCAEFYANPFHGEFLAWARSNGIDPTNSSRLEVYEGDSGLFAKVTVYDLDDKGVKFVVPGTEDFSKHVATIPLSSMPPRPGCTDE
ncbi:hypothetical protein Ssi03_50720 [Sphaerisporangium siamense]|uniref:Uncharacterized protein n=1 Tax=Sphaerisporangium siamense TaxID=795645 RepID=A0A7W7D8G3_9ACTN|nr:hypothetical protein [Sphaerisporangium siamense]MBB4702224.1 hypothetical protein [Sphaerisporangium siamense]GII87082.1 hypothetical protein Ssi03_50720 [Sphaerisporangium siamense]